MTFESALGRSWRVGFESATVALLHQDVESVVRRGDFDFILDGAGLGGFENPVAV
jgi:hypothetical protein